MLEGARLHAEMEKEAFLRPLAQAAGRAVGRASQRMAPMTPNRARQIDNLNTAMTAQRRANMAARMPSRLNPLGYGGLKGFAVGGLGGYGAIRGGLHSGLLNAEQINRAAEGIRNFGISINPEYWALRNINPIISKGQSETALNAFMNSGTDAALAATKKFNTDWWQGALANPEGGFLRGLGEFGSTMGTTAGSVAALPSTLALKGIGMLGSPGAATAAAIKSGLATVGGIPVLGAAAPIAMSMAGIYGLKKAVGLGSRLMSRAGRARRLRMLRAGYAPQGYDPRITNYYGLR